MTDYKKLYFKLFNGISDVTLQLEQLDKSLINSTELIKLKQCILKLKEIQVETEEMYISNN